MKIVLKKTKFSDIRYLTKELSIINKTKKIRKRELFGTSKVEMRNNKGPKGIP
jgi:hypothetical protein